MIQNAFDKFKRNAQSEQLVVPTIAPQDKPQKKPEQRVLPTQPGKQPSYRQVLKERQQRIDRQKDFTLCFTNCAPDLTSEKLEIAVKHALDIPALVFKQDKIFQLLKDGTFQEVEEAQKEQLESANIVESVYFKADNYNVYDKEQHKHIEKEINMYKTKVGFVLFKTKVTDTIFQKLKVIEVKNRTLFGNTDLQYQINRDDSIFVTGIRQQSNLQQLITFVQKYVKSQQPENKLINMKNYYEEQKIKAYLYLEFKLPLNDKLKKQLYNKVIEIPNEVKLVKCLCEKKAHKRVERVQRNKKFQESKLRQSGVMSNKPQRRQFISKNYQRK